VTDRLTAAQRDALDALAGLSPPFSLTGGAALAAVYLGHRATRDLDLFFHDLAALGRLPEEAAHRLREGGFEAQVQERFATFSRILARRGGEVVVVDLVADPVPTLEPPVEQRIGRELVHVDTLREIMANKLCALLGRSELRDLVDLRALLARGHSLPPALGDASKKDSGFSPLQLAWALRGFPVAKVAKAEGLADPEVADLERFRSELIEELLRQTTPSAT